MAEGHLHRLSRKNVSTMTSIDPPTRFSGRTLLLGLLMVAPHRMQGGWLNPKADSGQAKQDQVRKLRHRRLIELFGALTFDFIGAFLGLTLPAVGYRLVGEWAAVTGAEPHSYAQTAAPALSPAGST